MATIAELEREILQLPEDQRVSLIHRVFEKSDASREGDVFTLWEDEIVRRIERLDQGMTQRISASEVFRELDESLS